MKLPSKKSLAGLTATILATACVGLASWGFDKPSARGINVSFSTKELRCRRAPIGWRSLITLQHPWCSFTENIWRSIAPC